MTGDQYVVVLRLCHLPKEHRIGVGARRGCLAGRSQRRYRSNALADSREPVHFSRVRVDQPQDEALLAMQVLVGADEGPDELCGTGLVSNESLRLALGE